jgi:hypothetical protein
MNSVAETVQIARINRRLARRNEKLCTSRSYGHKSNLGRFYVLNTWTNVVVDFQIVSLDEFERDLEQALRSAA